MVNQQVLASKWNQVSGKLKERWGKLTDDDLRTFSGNVDQLVGQIQRKTGESRAAIEEFLGDVADDVSQAAASLGERAQESAAAAAEKASQAYEALREGYSRTERVVQDRPGQSMAIAFGLGMLAGVGVALLFRDRPSESALARGRAASEHLRCQLRDLLASLMPKVD